MSVTLFDRSRLPDGVEGAIGVFDSGVGGLDVAAAISEVLPYERLIYWGDNARVPYGTKSAQVVRAYTREAGYHLASLGVKALVIACNTASAVVDFQELSEELGIPVLGMIDAGVRACMKSASQLETEVHIVILATPGTIRSRAYERALMSALPNARISSIACPLFVPLVEMGWGDHHLSSQLVSAQLMESGLFETTAAHPSQTLIVLLGCTHYPLMARSIQLGISAHIDGQLICVDGARSVAQQLATILTARNQLSSNQVEKRIPQHQAIFTDDLNGSASTQLALAFWQNREGRGELTLLTVNDLR